MADTEELKQFYENYYDKGNFGDRKAKQKAKRTIEEIKRAPVIASRRLDRSTEYYTGNGNFLDIGFGLGVHAFMASALGYRVHGTEFDRACVEFCQEFLPEAQFFHGDLLSAQYDGEKFDLINVSHVIEHVIDPLSYLREFERIMKPGGTLIIGTPDIGAWPYAAFRVANFMSLNVPLVVDGLEHTVIFDKQNLRRTVEAHGFETVTQYSESFGDSLINILETNLSPRKKFLRYCQTKVKINQVIVARKKSLA
jgi:2-polyprenyl-3-methyl-5-hydroxy-6-metoxy-1,4-benzoquinol methylase